MASVLARTNQGDRFFWTRHHTESARMAGVGIGSKGLLPAVGIALQPSAQAEALAQIRWDSGYLEYAVGTDRHASLFAFAAIAIDDWLDRRRSLRTFLFLNSHCPMSQMFKPIG